VGPSASARRPETSFAKRRQDGYREVGIAVVISSSLVQSSPDSSRMTGKPEVNFPIADNSGVVAPA